MLRSSDRMVFLDEGIDKIVSEEEVVEIGRDILFPVGGVGSHYYHREEHYVCQQVVRVEAEGKRDQELLSHE